LAIVKAVQDMGEYREAMPTAVRLLREATILDPQDREAWNARGWAILYLNGDLKEAAAAFDTVLSGWPDDEEALRDAAKASHRLGDYDKARDYWRRALQVNPWMGIYHFNLALTLSRMGRWDEARQQCQETLDLEPFHAQARVLLAVCYHRLGDGQRAQSEFEKVRSLHPPSFDALEKQFLQETRKP
jgi:tetratricopeptide (TPR) repeat protein